MRKVTEAFESEYKKLNLAQREAVESILGPVMVVAGPGTGKTQVLALRIGNILLKTDTPADGVLCLTFTNSAVEAMRSRLVRYIGEAGEKVRVFTFHSFGMKIIEENFPVLGLKESPRLLDETEAATFFDDIFQSHAWEYLRPRSDRTKYYKDLKLLISLLKRERISSRKFASSIEEEIQILKDDKQNISSRGVRKGELKQEVRHEIEGLEKSREISKFLELYEAAKAERGMIDYDDVLENLVKIVEKSEEVRAEIREKYLYILIDEHQDSSRVQNEFIARVWMDVEKPDIFVVGDDRQLIYGFSGASIEHFKSFRKTFPGAKLIPLLLNYRSTKVILDAAHTLLQSVMTEEKLVSVRKESHSIKLVEAETPREEIRAAAEDIRGKIGQGMRPDDCAVLLPKNAQVRDALEILHKEGVPIATFETLNIFDQKEMSALMRVLKIIDSGDAPSLALSFFDEYSGILPLEAHAFLSDQKMREFSFDALVNRSSSLFKESAVEKWISKLSSWKKYYLDHDVKSLIQKIAEELFAPQEGGLISGKEIALSLFTLLEGREDLTLHDFVSYLGRLELYGEMIPVLTDKKKGARVLTMHASKGLEFDYVWIAHMDERSLGGGKKLSFTLPKKIRELIEEKDIDAVKRKLYVAITRAKRFCTLSYAGTSHKGAEQELAKIIASLPKEVFEKHKVKAEKKQKSPPKNLSALAKLVGEKYKDRYISASFLNNFFECPWKWYFQNLLQLPEEVSESLEFGGKVHAAIDQVLKNSGEVTEKILEEIAGGDKVILKIISSWAKNRLKEITKNRENEQPISIEDKNFPHLKFYGRLDLIEKLESKNVRVTDFKTGSPRKKHEIEKLDNEGRLGGNLRQLAMYAYLLQNSPAWQGVAVSESRLEFLEAREKSESIYNYVITSEEINLLLKDIKDYDDLVKNGEWINRPCNYNSYGKNTSCEYCKTAEIFTGSSKKLK
ncbi:ATP-dependent helicase [Candidatus Nomurabacteria bacterium]|nr:ATP-dependent helicase [Candidatus Nomurabacteria bacterium]